MYVDPKLVSVCSFLSMHHRSLTPFFITPFTVVDIILQYNTKVVCISHFQRHSPRLSLVTTPARIYVCYSTLKMRNLFYVFYNHVTTCTFIKFDQRIIWPVIACTPISADCELNTCLPVLVLDPGKILPCRSWAMVVIIRTLIACRF